MSIVLYNVTNVTLSYMDDLLTAKRIRLGRYLRDIREDVPLTQQELADRTKFSRQTINRIEKGETGVRQNSLLTIVRGLGLMPTDKRFGTIYQLAGYIPPTTYDETVQTRTGYSSGTDDTLTRQDIEDLKARPPYDFMNDDTLSPEARERLIRQIEALYRIEKEQAERERRARGEGMEPRDEEGH
jgi:transcriptional regulator with XRE-family HTH domain